MSEAELDLMIAYRHLRRALHHSRRACRNIPAGRYADAPAGAHGIAGLILTSLSTTERMVRGDISRLIEPVEIESCAKPPPYKTGQADTPEKDNRLEIKNMQSYEQAGG